MKSWRATPVLGLVAAALVLLTPSVATAALLSHWTFDDGSGQTVADSAGTNNGTRGASSSSGSDDPAWTAGKIGGWALSFDGGDHVFCGTNNTITNLAGHKTFSFWTANQESPRGDGFLGVDNNTSANRWYLDDNFHGDDLRIYRMVGTSGAFLLTTNSDCLKNSGWQHVAVVDDGNRWKAYVDGDFVGQGAAGTSFDFTSFTDPANVAFRIGSVRHSGSRPTLRGLMDDVAVWNNALSPTEIKAVHGLGDNATLNHNASHAQQLFTLFDTVDGKAQVAGRVWRKATGLAGSAGEVQDLGGGNFAVALDGGGNGVETWGGLIGHWKFDDGSGQTVADSAGGNHGVRGNTTGVGSSDPTWTTGRVGGALDFNRSNSQLVTIGSDNAVTNLAGQKTFAFWIEPHAAGGSNGIIGLDADANNRWYIDDSNVGGDVRMYARVGGGQKMLEQVNDVLTYGTWQHVTVVDNGTSLRFFVDGEFKGTRADSFDLADLPQLTSVLRIGRIRHGVGPHYYDGRIDDVAVWNVALSDTRVTALHRVADNATLNYDAGQAQQLFTLFDGGTGSTSVGALAWRNAGGLSGTPGHVQDLGGGSFAVVLDGSGNGVRSWKGLVAHWSLDDGGGQTATDSAGGNHGTLGTSSGDNSRDPTWAAGRIGGALSFNNDLVDCGSDNAVTNLSGEKTFAFWTNTIQGGSNGYLGLTTPRPPNSANRWYVDDCNSEGRIRIARINDAVPVNDTSATAAGVLAYGTWQHVAIVDNGTNLEVFINGVSQGTVGVSFDHSSLPMTSVFTMGRVPFSTSYQYLNGLMDDVGVWNVALTDAEVMALFSVGDSSTFNYDLGQVQSLFDLHAAGEGRLDIGQCAWFYGTGLNTPLGELTRISGSEYHLRLDANGAGVVGVIPEPATIVLLALGIPALRFRRRRR